MEIVWRTKVECFLEGCKKEKTGLVWSQKEGKAKERG